MVGADEYNVVIAWTQRTKRSPKFPDVLPWYDVNARQNCLWMLPRQIPKLSPPTGSLGIWGRRQRCGGLSLRT